MQSFSERKASAYIKALTSAVYYMHSLNIAHRDIKAQNLMFNKAGAQGVLQLIDFGEGKVVYDNDENNDFVGTIHYVRSMCLQITSMYIYM